MNDETTTTTVTARGVPVEVAEEIRHYAGAQGMTLGEVVAGLWRFRRALLEADAADIGRASEHQAARAGVPRGRAL